jgi:hypothetical protein
LPEAFMATVCASKGIDDPMLAKQSAREETPVQIDLPVDKPATRQPDVGPQTEVSAPADSQDQSADASGLRPPQPVSGSVRNAGADVTMPGTAAAPALEEPKPLRQQSSSLAGSLVGADRSARTNDDAAPELDRARAAVFADTIEALHAVIAEQRVMSARLARRMKTMLAVIACMLVVTVAGGVVQTVALLRMDRQSTLRQQRIEEMLLDQQATLASLFDTDSANVAIPNAPIAPKTNTPNAATDDATKKHGAKHTRKLH